MSKLKIPILGNKHEVSRDTNVLNTNVLKHEQAIIFRLICGMFIKSTF